MSFKSSKGRSMVSYRYTIACAVLFMGLPGAAGARNTEHLLPVSDAVSSELGQAHLIGVPYFFKGQAGPPVAEQLLQLDTSQATRGAFRSDEESCNVAFLSALRVLQDRAQLEGGDAVIDIVSITRRKRTESPTQFRCVAGAMVVHVGLRGMIVRLRAPEDDQSTPAAPNSP